MENGTLMILSGALVVIKATRRSNLYVYLLRGSTCEGGAIPISNITSEDATDTTRLSHICLGHVGEKSYQKWR